VSDFIVSEDVCTIRVSTFIGLGKFIAEGYRLKIVPKNIKIL